MSANTTHLPPDMGRSTLMRLGGFAIYEGLPDANAFVQLHNEALAQYQYADVQENWESDSTEGRGGKPMRSLLTAQAGPIQDAWYLSASLTDFIFAVCGMPMIPSGTRGSYSYYVRAGDFLDLHRDVDTCDVTVITALHDNSHASDQAGSLVLYPNRIAEPLSAIRACPFDGAHPVKLLPGQTIVMFGGIVPHRLLPVREGQCRIISVLCFQALVPYRH